MSDFRACTNPDCLRERCYYDEDQVTQALCLACTADTKEIYEESPFSNAINEFIRNIGELLFYVELELTEDRINERPCLVRADLEFDAPIAGVGLTNRQLIKANRVPIDPKSNNEKVHLHHIGQKADSPFAELTADEDISFRCNPIHFFEDTMIDRRHYQKERRAHWKHRIQRADAAQC